MKVKLFTFGLTLMPVMAYASEFEVTNDLEGRWIVFLDWSLMAAYYGLKGWV